MSIRPYRNRTWLVVVEGTDPATGKRRQTKLVHDPDDPDPKAPIKTKKRALEIEAAERVKRATGTAIPRANATVGEYLEGWLAQIKPTMAASSHLNWRSVVKTRIAPYLGTVPLQRLTVLHVEAWLQQLQPRYKHNTIAQAKSVLAAALRDAVRWRLLSTSPMNDVRRLKREVPDEKVVWSATEARAFLAYLEKERVGDGTTDASPLSEPARRPHAHDTMYAALWRLLLDSGMRIGEALALTWGDLGEGGVAGAARSRNAPRLLAEPDSGQCTTVRITKTLAKRGKEDGGGWVVAERTKTASSRRTVAISARTAKALRKHELAQKAYRLSIADVWENRNLIFTNATGGVLSPATTRERLDRDAKAAGVPRITHHQLRHACSTLLAADGVPLPTIMRRLGHSNVGMTFGTYTHAEAEADRSAADALARVLEG